jgi:hypothetical protein
MRTLCSTDETAVSLTVWASAKDKYNSYSKDACLWAVELALLIVLAD